MLWRQGCLGQEARHAEDAVHRLPQFMAHGSNAGEQERTPRRGVGAPAVARTRSSARHDAMPRSGGHRGAGPIHIEIRSQVRTILLTHQLRPRRILTIFLLPSARSGQQGTRTCLPAQDEILCCPIPTRRPWSIAQRTDLPAQRGRPQLVEPPFTMDDQAARKNWLWMLAYDHPGAGPVGRQARHPLHHPVDGLTGTIGGRA